MNTVGKILVILNFLFAVIVGVLLVIVGATQNQWKESYYALEREAKAMKLGRDNDQKMMVKILNDYQQASLKVEEIKQTIKDKEVAAAVMEDKYKVDIEDYKNKLKDSDLTLTQTKQAKQRLVEEIALLTKVVKERETSIVKLEADIRTFRLTAQNYESISRDKQTKNENLLEQIRDLSRKLAERESGVNSDTVVIRNPNDPNPPAVTINGKIEKVSDNLVELSIGTDQGLGKGNTLDVYRLQPEPKYLGMVRITDANHHKSVGRLVPSGNAQFRPQLREGDLVTSKITK